jgi:hypothetical protein
LSQLASFWKLLSTAEAIQLVVPPAHGAAEAEAGANTASTPVRTASMTTRTTIDLPLNGLPLDCFPNK